MPSRKATLESFYDAAVRQWRYMLPREDDVGFVKNEGEIFYAVDADVIKLYTAPHFMASTKSGGPGYADVFPDDEETLSIALGRALADHIFFHQAGEDGFLLILPPIDTEIRGIFHAVNRDIESELDKVQLEHERLRMIVNQLNEKKDSEGELFHEAQNAYANLLPFLVGTSFAKAEQARFGHLFAASRVMSLENAVKQGFFNNSDEDVRRAMSPPEAVSDMFHFREMADDWFERIREKAKRRKNILVQDDAQALARLELINEKLEGTRYRLTYITGDPSLLEAAGDYRPWGESSFAELYLRHPKAFLGESCVLAPATEAGDQRSGNPGIGRSFKDSLYYLLREAMQGAENEVEASTKNSEMSEPLSEPDGDFKLVEKVHPELVKDFKRRWADHTRDFALTKPIPEWKGEWPGDLAQLKTNFDDLLAEIEDKLKAEAEETWDQFIDTTMTAGYGLLFYSPEKHQRGRSRNPPALAYDKHPEINDFVENILSSPEHGGMNAATYKNLLTNLDRQDPSNYTFRLAYALLFAAQGYWYEATITAARALSIARRNRPSGISGREAAYLFAIALRHDSMYVNGLEKAFDALEEAQAIAEAEQNNRLDDQAGWYGMIRYEVERNALFLTYHLFRIFRSEGPERKSSSFLDKSLRLLHGGGPDRKNPGLSDLLSECKILLSRCDDLFKEYRNDDIDPDIRSNVERLCADMERKLLTNLFTTVFLVSFKMKKHLNPAHFREFATRFREITKDTDQPTFKASYLIEVTCLAALFWTEEDRGNRKQVGDRLRRRLSDARHHFVFPYDEKRFAFLRDEVAS